jgi:hypothetical protein
MVPLCIAGWKHKGGIIQADWTDGRGPFWEFDVQCRFLPALQEYVVALAFLRESAECRVFLSKRKGAR